MFYRNRRPWRRNRGFRFLWGWPFVFVLILGFSHHWFLGMMMGLVMLILLGLIIRALLWPLLFGAGMWGIWSSMNNRSNQQPYQNQQGYQDYQPYQQHQPYQQGYQPYQQGYQPRQPASETYQEGGRQYQYPQQSQYDQYEQPQAQYPQEMSPMEQ